MKHILILLCLISSTVFAQIPLDTVTSVNVGTVPGDGTGDTLYIGIIKLNTNDSVLLKNDSTLREAILTGGTDWDVIIDTIDQEISNYHDTVPFITYDSISYYSLTVDIEDSLTAQRTYTDQEIQNFSDTLTRGLLGNDSLWVQQQISDSISDFETTIEISQHIQDSLLSADSISANVINVQSIYTEEIVDSLKISGQAYSVLFVETQETLKDIDFRDGNVCRYDVTGTTTIDILNVRAGSSCVLIIHQDGTGQTVNIGTGWGTAMDGSATISTGINKKSLVQFINDGDTLMYNISTSN